MYKTYHFLDEEADRLRRRAAKYRDDCYDPPVTAQLTGMPGGGGRSDSTARTAMSGNSARNALLASRCDERAAAIENLKNDISSRLRLLTREERLILCAVDWCYLPMWAARARLTPKRSERWWYYTLKRARSRMVG